MKKPAIERVADNDDKRFTYATATERLKEAMLSGFYLEALLIDGALIEDRIRSFLFHLGVFELRESREANANISRQLLRMPGVKSNKNLGTLKVDTLEAEIALVNATIKWSNSTNTQPEDAYLCAIWAQYRSHVNIDHLRNALNRADQWRKVRNEVIHAMLHKHIESLDEKLSDHCEEGEAIFRALDQCVDQVKRNESIRKAINLTD